MTQSKICTQWQSNNWETFFLLAVVVVLWKHLVWLQTWLPTDPSGVFMLVLAGIVALIYNNYRPMLRERIHIYQVLFVGFIAVGYLPDVFSWLNPAPPPIPTLERPSDARGFIRLDDVGVRPWYVNNLPLLGFLCASLLSRLGRWLSAQGEA